MKAGVDRIVGSSHDKLRGSLRPGGAWLTPIFFAVTRDFGHVAMYRLESILDADERMFDILTKRQNSTGRDALTFFYCFSGISRTVQAHGGE